MVVVIIYVKHLPKDSLLHKYFAVADKSLYNSRSRLVYTA